MPMNYVTSGLTIQRFRMACIARPQKAANQILNAIGAELSSAPPA